MTPLGKWAVAFALASILLVPAWRLMGPLGGFPAIVLGLVGGGVALAAIVREHERAVLVYVALVPFLNAAGFLIGSLAFGD